MKGGSESVFKCYFEDGLSESGNFEISGSIIVAAIFLLHLSHRTYLIRERFARYASTTLVENLAQSPRLSAFQGVSWSRYGRQISSVSLDCAQSVDNRKGHYETEDGVGKRIEYSGFSSGRKAGGGDMVVVTVWRRY
ncbi:uncharacterized protein [Prorops nasuta]|uniref:uncharacterized protein n=1 Tax=Prorops nasuta TaxID=863751 RepID=UPI0034CEC535